MQKGFLNIIWGVFSKLFSGLKLAIFGIMVARYLGPEKFGIISYVVSFVSLLSVLAEFRLNNILLREISKGNNIEKLLGTSFYICFFFATIGYLTLSFIAYSIKDSIDIKIFIVLYGLSYFFQMFRFLRAYFIAKQKNNIIVKSELITTIIILLLTYILIILKTSITYFIILRVLDLLLFSVIMLTFYNNKYGKIKKWKYDKSIKNKLIKDSFPLVLSGFALIVFQKIDQIMIKHFIDSEAVGQYAAAVSVTSIIAFIPIVISESLVPILVKIREKDNDQYIWFRQRFSDFLTWSSILMSFVIMITSPIIIKLLYGESYLPSIEIMKIFAWKGFFIGIGAVAGQIMIIENTHQISYIKSIVGGCVNLILNFFFIQEYGSIGAVWASILAFAASSYITHLFIFRYKYIFKIQTKSIFYGIYYIIKDFRRFFKIATANL
ncbi:flippase [Aquimarina rhabdastrellae]